MEEGFVERCRKNKIKILLYRIMKKKKRKTIFDRRNFEGGVEYNNEGK